MNTDGTEDGIRIDIAEHGQGLFAMRPFPVDVAVGQIQGHVIHDPDYYSDYCIDLNDETSLEPAAPYRYLNHSCAPNCQLVQYDVEDDGAIVGVEVWLETIRPIVAGEQLTIDYAWPANSAIPCGCGSERCRGWIVAEEELDGLPPAPPQPELPGEETVSAA